MEGRGGEGRGDRRGREESGMKDIRAEEGGTRK